jgi:hypothetical protein
MIASHSSSYGAGAIGQQWPQNCGLGSTPLRKKKKEKEMRFVFMEADAEFLNVISSNKFMVTKSGYFLINYVVLTPNVSIMFFFSFFESCYLSPEEIVYA